MTQEPQKFKLPDNIMEGLAEIASRAQTVAYENYKAGGAFLVDVPLVPDTFLDETKSWKPFSEAYDRLAGDLSFMNIWLANKAAKNATDGADIGAVLAERLHEGSGENNRRYSLVAAGNTTAAFAEYDPDNSTVNLITITPTSRLKPGSEAETEITHHPFLVSTFEVATIGDSIKAARSEPLVLMALSPEETATLKEYQARLFEGTPYQPWSSEGGDNMVGIAKDGQIYAFDRGETLYKPDFKERIAAAAQTDEFGVLDTDPVTGEPTDKAISEHIEAMLMGELRQGNELIARRERDLRDDPRYPGEQIALMTGITHLGRSGPAAWGEATPSTPSR